jgi:hypothetical protein
MVVVLSYGPPADGVKGPFAPAASARERIGAQRAVRPAETADSRSMPRPAKAGRTTPLQSDGNSVAGFVVVMRALHEI